MRSRDGLRGPSWGVHPPGLHGQAGSRCIPPAAFVLCSVRPPLSLKFPWGTHVVREGTPRWGMRECGHAGMQLGCPPLHPVPGPGPVLLFEARRRWSRVSCLQLADRLLLGVDAGRSHRLSRTTGIKGAFEKRQLGFTFPCPGLTPPSWMDCSLSLMTVEY